MEYAGASNSQAATILKYTRTAPGYVEIIVKYVGDILEYIKTILK